MTLPLESFRASECRLGAFSEEDAEDEEILLTCEGLRGSVTLLLGGASSSRIPRTGIWIILTQIPKSEAVSLPS